MVSPVTATPWGDSRELKARRLRPGPGASREDVEANQRERIFGAMVAAIDEHGYEATRVADVLELSGVSRNTFYKHFDNKLDCFLATMDAVILCGGSNVVATYLDHPGPWDARLADGLVELIATLVAQPAAARLFYVESHAAGPQAIAKINEFGDQIFQISRQSLEESPAHRGLPTDLLRSILRGIRRMMQRRLRAGREEELIELGPRIFAWAVGYPTPPRPLEHQHGPRPQEPTKPAVDLEDPRERILAAVVELMATKGYQALTITDIAQRGAVSLTTFYNHFEGKDDAVVSALRRSMRRVDAAVAPALQAAPDWPQAMGAGLHAFFDYLSNERLYARFGGVDSHGGSQPVVHVRERLLARAQGLLGGGYEIVPDVDPIASEAIGASIDALVFEQIVRNGEDRLYEIAPTAIYLALTPFVGAEAACAIANQDR